MRSRIMAAMLALGVVSAASAAGESEICIEAEEMIIESGWRPAAGYEGYMPSEPGRWSAGRLRADETDEPAAARADFTVPRAGAWNLWVRYESAAGFDSLFTVEVIQAGRIRAAAEFGGKEQSKYFPFGRRWQVQGLWTYHNADWVYQKAALALDAGPATLLLKKGRNGRPAGLRVVDLFYLTTDLTLEPGDEWKWPASADKAPPILNRFKSRAFLKLRVSPTATGPALAQVQPRLWQVGYYHGPRDIYYFTANGISTQKPAEAEWLAPGVQTEWAEINLHRVYPSVLLAKANQPAEIMVCRDPGSPRDTLLTAAVGPLDTNTFPLAPWNGDFNDPDVCQIIVSTGNDVYEKDLLKGRFAAVFTDYLEQLLKDIEALDVPGGKKPSRLHVLTAFPPRINTFDMRRLMSALGINGSYMQSHPAVYGPEGKAMGFLQNRGFISLQNAHISLRPGAAGRDCYEGDFEPLRMTYEKRFEALKADGLGELPQTIKLIEEAGAPSFTALRPWDKINEQFRAYLKERGVGPLETLSREAMAGLLAMGRAPTQDELWAKVAVGAGDPAEAETNPALFYHSHCFRAWILARNCAGATRTAEAVFPAGSRTHSGSFLPCVGGSPALNHGTDPFLLFKERGVTAYSSEISWQLNLPDYVGVQMQSYEAALSRALAKYHKVPRGSYLISDRNRGYSPEFVELATYVFAANGFEFWNYYTLYYPEGCSILGCPDNLKAIRRAVLTVGAVEDRLADSDAVPARTAIGWSQTSDVWDMSHPRPKPEWLAPGNTIYSGEKPYLYLLLRHLHQPVDILSETDLTEGYLKDYSAYFLVGDHLRPEAAEALRKWVEDGGTLVSVAGGGLLDHYNRPLDTLKPVFGISDARLEKKAETLRPKLELVHAQPVDTLTISAGAGQTTLPAYGYRQTFTISNGTAVARFGNGETGAVFNTYGKGKALIIGALPGTAYLSGAFPLKPFGRGGEDLSSIIFPNYNTVVREALRSLLADLLPPPPVCASNPLVEPLLLRDRTSGAYSVALLNFSGKTIKDLEVRIASKAAGNPSRAAAAFGSAKSSLDGDTLNAALALDKFDLLELRK